jgi:hypothetical protein
LHAAVTATALDFSDLASIASAAKQPTALHLPHQPAHAAQNAHICATSSLV